MLNPRTVVSRRAAHRLGMAAALASATALTACNGSGSDSASATAGQQSASPAAPASPTASAAQGPTGAPTAAESPAPANPLTADDASAAPQTDWTSEATEQASAGSCGVVVDLRTGLHEGYDRVVVEMSGDGTPGWLATWVEQASTLGKGDPITISGEHLLQVVGSGTSMPAGQEDLDRLYDGAARLTVGGPGIAEVWFDHTFESEFQVVVGAHALDYRIFTLSSPTRLVIDVPHP